MNIVVHESGMVNIDIDDVLAYANIRNMYTENRDGVGMQLDEKFEDKRYEIFDVCDELSALIYKLQDTIESVSVPKTSTVTNDNKEVI
jgi:hypothetical protein